MNEGAMREALDVSKIFIYLFIYLFVYLFVFLFVNLSTHAYRTHAPMCEC